MIYSRSAHYSPDTLRRKQWRSSDNGTLVERVLLALKIIGIGPINLSQQYESQQDSSNQVICVHWSWLSSFHFTILTSKTSSDEDFSSLDVWLCPAALLSHDGQTIWRIPPHLCRDLPSQLEGINFSPSVWRNWPRTLREPSRGWLGRKNLCTGFLRIMTPTLGGEY